MRRRALLAVILILLCAVVFGVDGVVPTSVASHTGVMLATLSHGPCGGVPIPCP